jgi:hypothetical protein
VNPEGLFSAFYHEASRRHAVIEDDGITGWFYLHGPSDDPGRTADVESDVFVYNRIESIPIGDVSKYQPGPPPIAVGYGHKEAVCRDPKCHQWHVDWLDHRGSVVLLRDGVPWSAIIQGEKRGYSKSIKTDGPWGHPWHDGLLAEIG